MGYLVFGKGVGDGGHVGAYCAHHVLHRDGEGVGDGGHVGAY